MEPISSSVNYVRAASPPPTSAPVPPSPPPPPDRAPAAGDGDLLAPAAISPPLGFESLAYGTDASAPLVATDRSWAHGGIGTPPVVARVREAGIANFASPEWQAIVADHAVRNGGLGDAEHGYLAFSENLGFVRFANPNLTDEQNRKLAAISLQTGWSIEDMPSRTADGGAEVGQWVDEFIGRYETEMAAFVANPGDGVEVRDGKRRFKLELNQEAQRVVSYDYRKKGGLRGWVQKQFKYIAPALDVLTLAVNVVPGIGQVASAALALGSQALKVGASALAAGKVAVQQVVGAVASVLSPAGRAVAGVVTDVLDDGKVSAQSIAAAVAPAITGLPGGPVTDAVVQQGIGVVAEAIDGGDIDARDLAAVLAPVVGARFGEQAAGQLAVLADAIDRGDFDARHAAGLLGPLLGRIAGDDPTTAALLDRGLRVAAAAIDGGEVSAQQVVSDLVAAVLAHRRTAPPHAA